MGATDWDESVFAVAGASATPLTKVPIASLSFTERAHLQEWVIANPAVLAPDALVIAFEFDKWRASGAAPLDRLDVLALGRDGRLVVAELKRGTAPDTTDVQAIKYAAMASRFTVELLAAKRHDFLKGRGETPGDVDSVLADLVAHTDGRLSEESLRRPRIALLAEDFSVTTTTSAVWLTEMGLDITLIAYRAYQTPGGEQIVTTSRIWPVPQAAQFVAVPRADAVAAEDDLPEIDWSESDLAAFASGAGPFMLRVLNTLAAHPGEQWNGTDFGQVGFTPSQTAGALGAITTRSRHKFGRRNTPITFTPTGGTWAWSMAPEIAERWCAVQPTDPS